MEQPQRWNESKPRVLIFGGCGFIGRHLVQYLVENELTEEIRVVDKVPPDMAWLHLDDKQKASFAQVNFHSANLIYIESVAKAYQREDGHLFDLVINLAAQTRYGLSDEVYEEGIVKLSMNCAKAAAENNVKCFIELSTGQVYNGSKYPSDENSKTSPWTSIGKHKLIVEEKLKSIEGLHYIIVRPAIVYGPGDKTGLMPRLVVGAVYKVLQEKMKLLWSGDLHLNMVHVHDLSRAIWFLAQRGATAEVYNVVDDADATQGSVTDFVCQTFGIQAGYMGSIMSNLATKFSMDEIADDCNDKHLGPWMKACQADGITNTPLNPFIDKELLYNKHLFLDGKKLKKLGFHCDKPQLTLDLIREVLNEYVEIKLFPNSLL